MKYGKIGFFVVATASVVLLSSCGMAPPMESATVAVQPDKSPVRNVTSFTESLKCMDDLFIRYGKTVPLPVMSAGILDATGKVMVGTKDMLISAIAKMSARSHAIKYIDYDVSPQQADVSVMQGLVNQATGGKSMTAPELYIRGAITQVDDGAIGTMQGGGLNYSSPMPQTVMPMPGQPIPNASPPQYSVNLGASQSAKSLVISVDMNVGVVATREIQPEYNSSNQIIVTRSGKNIDASGTIAGFGLNFNMSLDRNQGTHQAVRTLVELGAIEVIGKLQQVPYWQCLEIESTNPGAMSQARNWYDAMSLEERIRQIQIALNKLSIFKGSPSGQMDGALRDAISQYQQANGLIPSGRVDFDLYNQLLNANLVKGGNATDDRARNISVPTQVQRIAMTVRDARSPSTAGGVPDPNAPIGVHRVDEPIQVNVNLNRAAYVYCYYEDRRGTVSRIFPNRFQANALVGSGQTLQVPGNAPFRLRPDMPGVTERIACLAAPTEIGLTMPDELKTVELEPLPVRSVDDLFRRLNSPGMVTSLLNIKVIQK